MKYDKIFIYDTYAYDMYNYDKMQNLQNVVKCGKMYNFLYNNKVQKFTQHFVRGMSEKLACLLARWHAKLKNWHAVQHVGMFIDTLARKNEKLARFWHVGT